MNNLNSWKLIAPKLSEIADRTYGRSETIYPPRELVFTALQEVSPEDVRVVILGQDPYHSPGKGGSPGKACGRAFGYHPEYIGSTNSSLQNILIEVERDGYSKPADKSLAGWASQGVLLLNTRLTVEEDTPMSHAGIGWEEQIKLILKFLAEQTDKVIVWLAWGAEARKMIGRLDIQSEMHLVLTASHPCRHSVDRGPKPFRNCGHFRLTNKWLESWGLEPINWSK